MLKILIVLIALLTGCASTAQQPQQTQQPIQTQQSLPENSTFEVHYIDVGQADSALVLCDGYSMLIDGGNVADSDLIAAYLKKESIDELDYVVCTHAHEDHVGGLSGALSVASADNILAPKTGADTKAYKNFVSKAAAQGVEIAHPSAGDEFELGSSTVTVLGPISESADELNNTSIVLKVSYGDTSFLFTGDAEYEEEQAILNAGYDISADVLKVGHHGSDTSTSYLWLREIMPEYAIISVGAGNSYGHPDDTVLSRLRDADAQVYRTDIQGDIIAVSDGNSVSITTSRNAGAVTNETETAEYAYIGNKNSKKFHRPTCHTLPKESNRVYLSSREEAIAEGFSTCGQCNP